MSGSVRSERRSLRRRLLGWLLWVGLLLSIAVGGRGLGGSVLAPPPLGNPGSWSSWAGGRTPLQASFAVLALVVVSLAWYLLAVSLLGAGARLWGARRLVSVVDLVTLPVIRRSIHAALGVGLVGTSMAGVAGVAAIDRSARSGAIPFELVATTATAATEAGAGTTTVPDDGADDDPPVMQLLPDQVLGAHPIPAVPTGGLTQSEWEVRPGDHLWSVAEHVLERGGVGSTSDGAVAAYWRRLIVANADRLADPGNPDLILPGQVLTLPTPLPAGEGALP